MSGVLTDSEILCCQICSVKYSLRNNLPYSLNCGHTFCLYCILKLIKENVIVCPVDKKKIHVFNGDSVHRTYLKNLDFVRFLVVAKLAKKIDFSIFSNFSFYFCEDCGVILSHFHNYYKHNFMGHNLTKNLQEFFSKFTENVDYSEDPNYHNYYILMKFWNLDNFGFLNVENIETCEHIIEDKFYFVELNNEKLKFQTKNIFNDESFQEPKFGFLYLNSIKIIGFFFFDINKRLKKVFGFCVKKTPINTKEYFLGFINYVDHFKDKISLDFGIFIDSEKNYKMGIFSLEEESSLLFGESVNHVKGEIEVIPLNITNENEYFEQESHIKVFKKKNNLNNAFLDADYYIFYNFNTSENSVYLENLDFYKVAGIMSPYCKIEFPQKCSFFNIKLQDCFLIFSFFGKIKLNSNSFKNKIF